MSGVDIPLSQIKYRADIDGLRAIAVTSVVLFHAFPEYLHGGFIGVDVFFVISGYLITGIILQHNDGQKFSLIEFYSRRIKRIFPALIMVLGFSLVLGWFALFPEEYKQLGKHIAAGSAFLSNIISMGEGGYFDNIAETKPLVHLWSLGIEEQFYIFWPILIVFFNKRNWNMKLMIVTLIFLSFTLNINTRKFNLLVDFYSPQTRFWELLCGGLLASLPSDKHTIVMYTSAIFREFKLLSPDYEIQNDDIKIIRNSISFFGFFVLFCGFFIINKNMHFPGYWATLPVFSTIMIISAGSTSWLNNKILSNRFLVWIGLISFPLYMWHWPLLSFARIIEGELLDTKTRVLAITLSVLLAWMTYRIIEIPVRRLKSVNFAFFFLVPLVICIGAFGYLIHLNDGYSTRTSLQSNSDNKKELIMPPFTNNGCLGFVGKNQISFPYCKFTGASGTKTVAVIGDSHALVAYSGIADYLSQNKINTVLLSNSSCPPLIGLPIFGKSDADKDACNRRIEEIIEILLSKNEIRDVFFFTRGTIYFTGIEPFTGNVDVMNGKAVSVEDFRIATQKTIDTIVASGKRVFYVAENPELDKSPTVCIMRPFSFSAKDCRMDKLAVLSRQQMYISMIKSLKNATLIESIDKFCPDTKCDVFDANGKLLYADKDHLSYSGSTFQTQKLLTDYLDLR